MRFKDKIVVITGAASGMGLAAARKFAAEGATVALNDLKPESLEAAVGSIREAGGNAVAIAGDVADEAVAEASIREVVDRLGRVDVLVNNAGVSTIQPATDYAVWRRTMAINLDAPFYWSRAAATLTMIPNRSGAIVNVSSNAGFAAFPGDVGYIASKHGVTGLTKALAVEWAQYGIRVNCLCPGLTETNMIKQMETLDANRFVERRRRIPMGRIGKPEEQADAMLFLASGEASYVTGLIMNNDGGQMALYSGFSPN
ncbi:SDR family oxidoreductase [Pseudaminobacter sp. 19-2017]|uniref:SDR family oxidoreductase n=1 Tax=Pseudaminobacter soli (ex Zhang et al. 2022) TaxID=2831468 RepID=A0A942EBG8_9HYPH|nr:SDR family NAD(P)-dependent oxidoreductase [Pseudaminobacter soli]MBS3652032.1 SDR family oxidoreductase [Pseudaminobacter soli]